MAWKISFSPQATSDLKKLGAPEAGCVLKFLNERLQNRNNPREFGEPLKGVLREYWRYRVGDFRILCRLEDNTVTVLVVRIAHRREVYK